MDSPSSPVTLVGYHGCNYDHVGSIKKDNFRRSEKPTEWLGYGAYFFVEAFSDPTHNARDWAIAQAWDDGLSRYAYKKWAVLEASITSYSPFDLNSVEAKKQLPHAREVIEKRISQRMARERRTQRRKDEECSDCQIINFLADLYHYDVVIHDFYIKFERARRQRTFSRLPNTRVVCVRSPKSAIDLKTIRETWSGSIS